MLEVLSGPDMHKAWERVQNECEGRSNNQPKSPIPSTPAPAPRPSPLNPTPPAQARASGLGAFDHRFGGAGDAEAADVLAAFGGIALRCGSPTVDYEMKATIDP